MSKCKENAETSVWEPDTKTLVSKSCFVKQEVLHRNSWYALKQQLSSHTALLLCVKGSWVPCRGYTQNLYTKKGTSEVTVFTEQQSCLEQ